MRSNLAGKFEFLFLNKIFHRLPFRVYCLMHHSLSFRCMYTPLNFFGKIRGCSTDRFLGTVVYARANVIGSRTSFVIHLFVLAYIEIYVFRSIPFQAHSLQQSYHPTQSFKQEKYNKSVPLQAWSGPDGSRKLRFPDFMTTAQGGGKVVSLTHRPHLYPENSPGTHFC